MGAVTLSPVGVGVTTTLGTEPGYTGAPACLGGQHTVHIITLTGTLGDKIKQSVSLIQRSIVNAHTQFSP